MNQLIANLKDTEFKIDVNPKIDAKGNLVPDGVIISSTDIVEKIYRPSFYIDFEDNKTNLMLANSRERNLSVKLFYFAKNREKSKLELMELQDLLSNTFLRSLKVNENFYIPIKECDFDVNKKDGYLILNLELYTLEELDESMNPDANAEMMEELEINNEINKG